MKDNVEKWDLASRSVIPLIFKNKKFDNWKRITPFHKVSLYRIIETTLYFTRFYQLIVLPKKKFLFMNSPWRWIINAEWILTYSGKDFVFVSLKNFRLEYLKHSIIYPDYWAKTLYADTLLLVSKAHKNYIFRQLKKFWPDFNRVKWLS